MSKKILVIDDEPSVRSAFQLALEDKDYEIQTAENGAAGLELFGQGGFDLVFLDLKMPEMNGVQTLRRIRERDREVPVYIVTAFYQEYFEDLKACTEQGIAFELLEKPATAEQILLVAESVLES